MAYAFTAYAYACGQSITAYAYACGKSIMAYACGHISARTPAAHAVAVPSASTPPPHIFIKT